MCVTCIEVFPAAVLIPVSRLSEQLAVGPSYPTLNPLQLLPDPLPEGCSLPSHTPQRLTK